MSSPLFLGVVVLCAWVPVVVPRVAEGGACGLPGRKTPGETAGSAGRSAAKQVTERSGLHVTLPALGPITLGPPDQLAYLAGIATLTALEIIEWPIALVLAAGHLLAEQRRSNTMHAFGEALEQA